MPNIITTNHRLKQVRIVCRPKRKCEEKRQQSLVYLFIYLFFFSTLDMSPSNQPLQPYYNEFLRCTICSHDFEHDNSLYRPITLPICGHTMCGQCIDIIRNQNKCPQDQVSFGCNSVPLDQLPTNYPLLILLFDSLQVEAMGKGVVGNQLPFSHLVARRR